MKRRQWVITLTVLLALASVGVAADYRLGPSGGHGGTPFKFAIPEGARIVEVRLWAGKRLDAIQLIYKKADGSQEPSPKFGGSGGDLKKLTLGSDEYINLIKGKYGVRVDSLTIDLGNSKRDWYGFKVGGDGGSTEYMYEAPPGTEIIGFTGRAGDEIDAIGVILRARP